MKNFKRRDPLFSLCGLNCGLCPMYVGKYCPGCGGGEGNQSCAIARCSREHGGIEFCYLCEEYPCGKYEGIDRYDSFITHRNRRKDLERAKTDPEAYRAELAEKMEILERLLGNYNDGRRKNLFCIAANLMEIGDLRAAAGEIEAKTRAGQTLKEKAALAAETLHAIAGKRGIVLKLNKKPSE